MENLPAKFHEIFRLIIIGLDCIILVLLSTLINRYSTILKRFRSGRRFPIWVMLMTSSYVIFLISTCVGNVIKIKEEINLGTIISLVGCVVGIVGLWMKNGEFSTELERKF